MLLTISLGSGIFENGKEKKLAKNIYSSSDSRWIFGLLIGTLHLMSMIIRELREFVVLDFWGQKFIQRQPLFMPTDSTKKITSCNSCHWMIKVNRLHKLHRKLNP